MDLVNLTTISLPSLTQYSDFFGGIADVNYIGAVNTLLPLPFSLFETKTCVSPMYFQDQKNDVEIVYIEFELC
jgi:hypothetical protein